MLSPSKTLGFEKNVDEDGSEFNTIEEPNHREQGQDETKMILSSCQNLTRRLQPPSSKASRNGGLISVDGYFPEQVYIYTMK